MINIENVVKKYDDFTALNNVTTTINDGIVFGLIGTNGAGKSTLLRIICGVYKEDAGKITIDGENVWDNPTAKAKIMYLSDDQFFFVGETPNDMLKFYQSFYPEFDTDKFYKLMDAFSLDPKSKISSFSKGMKKQLSIFYGICAKTKYLLCDETFDGLDPVVRQTVKSLLLKEMGERDFTPIIASHNLRELEDICDHVGLLHKGGIILSKDLEDMKLEIFKVQCVFKQAEDEEKITDRFPVVKKEVRGQLHTLTLRGKKEDILNSLAEIDPIFYELLPLTLEEIFISETEVVGYDFTKLFE